MAKQFTFTASVCLFPQKGGWYYVTVPQEYTETLKPLAVRGLVAARVTVGKSSWNTSLLPKGDGSQFIALPAYVRNKGRIRVGATIEMLFTPR